MNLDKVPLYPYKFEAILKSKPWGGQQLYHQFGRGSNPSDKIGESWEISDRPNDQSMILNGPLKGTSLSDLIARYGTKLMGQSPRIEGRFPLLLKIIDAQDDLSLQVHPQDSYALKNENSLGKTEMWYILHTEPEALIYCGLKQNITIEQFHNALNSNDPIPCLQTYRVTTGDVFYLPAGTVHALGKGIVVAEIQENSDLTYRLYDWGRTDQNANTRPLHIEKGLQVIQQEADQIFRIKKGSEPIQPSRLLIQCKHFIVFEDKIQSHKIYISDHHCFEIFFMIKGHGTIEYNYESLDIKSGDFVLIPAHLTKYQISPHQDLHILRIKI